MISDRNFASFVRTMASVLEEIELRAAAKRARREKPTTSPVEAIEKSVLCNEPSKDARSEQRSFEPAA